MVYCGKPSRGCQMCRTRRIKCDETKPTCNQCAKSRRQCPGYKDDFDLVFRNETQATERRARRSLNKRGSASSGGHKQLDHPHVSIQHFADSADEFYYYNEDQPASIHGAFKIPLEQQALCYFLSNWVLVPHENVTRGYLDFLIPMIKAEEPGGHLSIAFTAVGLAALGNRPHSKRLLPLAGAKYAQALNLTNAALRDPVRAKTDQTLASVLLLGLFEGITSCRANIMGWGSHIDGAVALIKMRGKKSLRTQVGKALFINVRALMIINCLANSRAPEMGTEWWISDSIKDDISQEVTRLNLRVAELRADLNQFITNAQRTAENTEKMTALMRRAQALDREYDLWEESLPEEWRPKAVAWLDNVHNNDYLRAPMFPGRIDVYTSIWHAAAWNLERSSRLVVSGTVVRCIAWICAPTDYRTTPEYATSARQGSQMISDVVSSIPYHLGWTYDPHKGRMVPGDLSGFACGGKDDASGRALGGNFTIWPLFSANCSDFTTDAQRRYITGRLRFIAETMGINQASVLSYLQLRLPSMVVRRDGTGLAIPTSKTLAATSNPEADLPTSNTSTSAPSNSSTLTTIGPSSVDAGKLSAGGAGISYPKPKLVSVPRPINPAPTPAITNNPPMATTTTASLIHDPNIRRVGSTSSQSTTTNNATQYQPYPQSYQYPASSQSSSSYIASGNIGSIANTTSSYPQSTPAPTNLPAQAYPQPTAQSYPQDLRSIPGFAPVNAQQQNYSQMPTYPPVSQRHPSSYPDSSQSAQDFAAEERRREMGGGSRHP